MREPGPNATDAEMAVYCDRHRDAAAWGEARPTPMERLDVTIIRRCALAEENAPVDRKQLSRMIEVLSRDLENLRQAAS